MDLKTGLFNKIHNSAIVYQRISRKNNQQMWPGQHYAIEICEKGKTWNTRKNTDCWVLDQL